MLKAEKIEGIFSSKSSTRYSDSGKHLDTVRPGPVITQLAFRSKLWAWHGTEM